MVEGERKDRRERRTEGHSEERPSGEGRPLPGGLRPFVRSIRGRLLLLFLLTAAVPSFLMGFLGYWGAGRILEDRIRVEVERGARFQAERTDGLLAHVLRDAEAAAALLGIRNPAPEEAYRILRALRAGWNLYDGVALVAPDGRVVAASELSPEQARRLGLRLEDREYFREALAGRANLSDLLVSRYAAGAGETALAAAAPVRRGHRVVGVLLISLSGRVLSESLRDAFPAGRGQAYLVDRTGRVLSETRDAEELRRAGRVRRGTSLELRIATLGAERVAAGRYGAAVYEDYGGRRVVGGFAPLRVRPWGVLIEIPAGEAFAPIARIRGLMVCLGLGLGLLAAVGALAIGGGIARGLERLAGAVERFRGGDLQVRAAPERCTEIHRLAQGFNEMARRIRKLVSDLENRVAEREETNRRLQREVAERLRAEEELKGYREHLEETVATRTADLKAANEDLEEALGRARRLNDFGRALGDVLELEPDSLREQIALRASEALGAERCRILTWDRDFRAGDDGDLPAPVRVAIEGVRRTEIPLLASSALAAEEPEERAAREALGLRGLLILPPFAWGARAALMFFESSSRPFFEGDLALAESVSLLTSVTLENARLFQDIRRLARTDPLTGLPNRGHLFALAEREFAVARRYGRPLTVGMIDVDLFKSINDRYGHARGDAVLRGVAGRARALLRDVDLLGRYGGEEFVLLMPETGLEAARVAAERLRERIGTEPFSAEGEEIPVTVSLGLAAWEPRRDASLEALLQRADRALYEAKAAGRNRVVLDTPEG